MCSLPLGARMSERFRSGCDLKTRQLADGRAQEVEIGLPWESIDAAIDAFCYGLAVVTVEEVPDQEGDLRLGHDPRTHGAPETLEGETGEPLRPGLSARRRWASEA